MAPTRSARAKKFAELDEKPVKDFDPEADGAAEAESGSDEDEDATATEHYVSVGKSKLRQKEAPALGPKYTGVRVSRAALDDSSQGEDDDDEEEDEDEEEYDDPDLADLERDNIIDDEEIDSDEAFGEGEEEIFKKKGFTFKDSKSNKSTSTSKATTNGSPKRAVAADFMSSSEDEEDDDEEAGSESDDGSDEDGAGAQLGESYSEKHDLDDLDDLDDVDDEDEGESDEDSDEEDSDESDEDENMDARESGDGRSHLRSLMKEGQKSVVATISQAAKADAEKGVAVRQQRRAYDSLLNLRIRLQKGLVAINSVSEADAAGDDSTDKKPYEAAEEAAMKLWNAIDGFRVSLLPEQKAGQKRKREFDASANSSEIWQGMQATEELAAAKRKKVLDKWSNRVKSTTATVSKERQLSTAGSQSLVAVLESQLLNSDRMIKRTHVPRSCAPLQAAKKVAEDTSIYDDADFYQLLLKELVDQRTNDAGAGSNGNGSVPTVRWTAIKEAKTRKQVDRRASKGRKLRFTVHEKLQNFMAPENRRTWEDEAIDRLFGTLFGQRMQLKEDISDEEDDEMVAAEEGLKLFRS